MGEPRRIDKPEPGFFKLKKARNGPWVGAIIFRPCPISPFDGYPLDRHQPLEAEVNGKPAKVDRVWIAGKPIPEWEYRHLIDDRAYCRQFLPQAPEANPTKPVDLNELPPIF